eukprot:m.25946 g.25946  ORF g.25946 m.25946 type:complete len:52 (+) comp9950_c0_seq1:78-233(+)
MASPIIALITGLGVGGAFGLYIAQNYEVPRVRDVALRAVEWMNDKEQDYRK